MEKVEDDSLSDLVMVRPGPSCGRVRDDNAQNHAAKKQHDEDPGHHGAAMAAVCQALSSLGLAVTFFAMHVGLGTEYAGYGLGEGLLGLLEWW